MMATINDNTMVGPGEGKEVIKVAEGRAIETEDRESGSTFSNFVNWVAEKATHHMSDEMLLLTLLGYLDEQNVPGARDEEAVNRLRKLLSRTELRDFIVQNVFPMKELFSLLLKILRTAPPRMWNPVFEMEIILFFLENVSVRHKYVDWCDLACQIYSDIVYEYLMVYHKTNGDACYVCPCCLGRVGEPYPEFVPRDVSPIFFDFLPINQCYETKRTPFILDGVVLIHKACMDRCEISFNEDMQLYPTEWRFKPMFDAGKVKSHRLRRMEVVTFQWPAHWRDLICCNQIPGFMGLDSRYRLTYQLDNSFRTVESRNLSLEVLQEMTQFESRLGSELCHVIVDLKSPRRRPNSLQTPFDPVPRIAPRVQDFGFKLRHDLRYRSVILGVTEVLDHEKIKTYFCHAEKKENISVSPKPGCETYATYGEMLGVSRERIVVDFTATPPKTFIAPPAYVGGGFPILSHEDTPTHTPTDSGSPQGSGSVSGTTTPTSESPVENAISSPVLGAGVDCFGEDGPTEFIDHIDKKTRDVPFHEKTPIDSEMGQCRKLFEALKDMYHDGKVRDTEGFGWLPNALKGGAIFGGLTIGVAAVGILSYVLTEKMIRSSLQREGKAMTKGMPFFASVMEVGTKLMGATAALGFLVSAVELADLMSAIREISGLRSLFELLSSEPEYVYPAEYADLEPYDQATSDFINAIGEGVLYPEALSAVKFVFYDASHEVIPDLKGAAGAVYIKIRAKQLIYGLDSIKKKYTKTDPKRTALMTGSVLLLCGAMALGVYLARNNCEKELQQESVVPVNKDLVAIQEALNEVKVNLGLVTLKFGSPPPVAQICPVMKHECVHYGDCPKKLPISAGEVCNSVCGGHHCTHWSGCIPLEEEPVIPVNNGFTCSICLATGLTQAEANAHFVFHLEAAEQQRESLYGYNGAPHVKCIVSDCLVEPLEHELFDHFFSEHDFEEIDQFWTPELEDEYLNSEPKKQKHAAMQKVAPRGRPARVYAPVTTDVQIKAPTRGAARHGYDSMKGRQKGKQVFAKATADRLADRGGYKEVDPDPGYNKAYGDFLHQDWKDVVLRRARIPRPAPKFDTNIYDSVKVKMSSLTDQWSKMSYADMKRTANIYRLGLKDDISPHGDCFRGQIDQYIWDSWKKFADDSARYMPDNQKVVFNQLCSDTRPLGLILADPKYKDFDLQGLRDGLSSMAEQGHADVQEEWCSEWSDGVSGNTVVIAPRYGLCRFCTETIPLKEMKQHIRFTHPAISGFPMPGSNPKVVYPLPGPQLFVPPVTILRRPVEESLYDVQNIFHCDLCELSFPTKEFLLKHRLFVHQTSKMEERANPDYRGHELGKKYSISVFRDHDGKSVYNFCLTKIRFRGDNAYTAWIAPIADFKSEATSHVVVGGKKVYLNALTYNICGPFMIIPVAQIASDVDTLNATATEWAGGAVTIVRHFDTKNTVGQCVAGRRGDQVDYVCETVPGNCGSPVLTSSGQDSGSCIAIHAYGSIQGNRVVNVGHMFSLSTINRIRALLAYGGRDVRVTLN